MKLYLAILLIIMMSGIVEAVYVNDESFNQGNGIYLTIMNATVDNITCCISNTLYMNVSNHSITFTAGANKTVTNPSFISDNYTFTASGTAGYLNFSATMTNTTSSYNLASNNVIVESKSTINNNIWFNYTGTYPATLSITPTPATTTSFGGGGGGGGTTIINYNNISISPSTNPPSVVISGSGLNWNIKIMNEGTSEQKYIINWVLKTQSGAIVDSGVLSKKILPNETYTVPLTFMGLFPGNYAIKVNVQYGIYQSEANQFFSVGINYSMTETIILLSILTAIFLASLYFRKPKR